MTDSENKTMKKIVLAEDDTFLNKVLSDQLKKDGFEVFQAHNGEEAIAFIKQHVPDVVLLDLIMPVKDGFEVLKEMKGSPDLAKIPVLILSNLGQDNDIQKAKNMGAMDYFVKANLAINEVVGKIKTVL